MAIINSVVTGSGNKSVGEVTLTRVHGRTVARKRMKTRVDKYSSEYQSQQLRLVNAQTLYRFVSQYVATTMRRENRYGSLYNTFVKKVINTTNAFGRMYWVSQFYSEWQATGFFPSLSSETHERLVASSMVSDGQYEFPTDRLPFPLQVGDVITSVGSPGQTDTETVFKIITASDVSAPALISAPFLRGSPTFVSVCLVSPARRFATRAPLWTIDEW